MPKGKDNSSFASLPYRQCVGIMLLNREGRVFIGRRMQSAGEEHVSGSYMWQMPQGGIDPGEAPIDAARRELYEETNIQTIQLLAEAPEWYAYDLPAIVAGRAWRGRFRGQIQKWFAFRFLGDDSEINTFQPAGGHYKAEFEDWRWEKMECLPELIIPFKRDVYEKVVAAFSHLVT